LVARSCFSVEQINAANGLGPVERNPAIAFGSFS